MPIFAETTVEKGLKVWEMSLKYRPAVHCFFNDAGYLVKDVQRWEKKSPPWMQQNKNLQRISCLK